MACSKAEQKRKKMELSIQFSRHVVNSLNREDRACEKKLEHLEKETQHNLRKIQAKLLIERKKSLSMQEQMKKEKAAAVSFTSKSLVAEGKSLVAEGKSKDSHSFNGESGKDLYASSGKKGSMLGTSAAERNAEHSGWKGRVAYQQ